MVYKALAGFSGFIGILYCETWITLFYVFLDFATIHQRYPPVSELINDGLPFNANGRS
jgi:hypothetical protein